MESDGRMEVIRGLCSFERRLPGTDAERRAANWLAGRLREQGRRSEVEPTYVHPQVALVHALHCAIGFAGSLIAVSWPAVGFALVLAAAASTYLDLHGRAYLLRSLFFRRASQNVFSPGRRPGARARLVLAANYDAGRTATGLGGAPGRLARRLARRAPSPAGPLRIAFWSLIALLALLGARLAGIDGLGIAIAQLAPTLALGLAAFALVDLRLSPASPGAGDNASGVAVALSLARDLDRRPPANLDVTVLLTGAANCLGEGMHAHLRAHRRELPRERTFFVCLESVGAGQPRYETAAGWVVGFDLDRRLVELAEAVAEAERAAGRRFDARPLRNGRAGESLPPRLRGLRAIGVSCRDPDAAADPDPAGDTPARVDPAALGRAHTFALALVRALDRDLDRDGPAPRAPAAPAAPR